MKVGVAVVVGLHLVIGDSTEGVLLHKSLEVVLSVRRTSNVLGRHSGEEGELVGGVAGGNLHVVLGLQRVVQHLEVGPSNLLHLRRVGEV